jgi:hypothetical protein
MSWVAVAVAGAAVVGGYVSSQSQEDAANTAANAQSNSAAAGIAEQRRQFDGIQKLLNPYVKAGTGALGAQQNLVGLHGGGAQQRAINGIQNSPQFHSLMQQGENSILQNSSATGGLRGGNTQAALAQFRPQLLSQLIDQQYSRLGGLTSVGQNAAAGVGNAGMQTGVGVSNLLQQQGAAQAGAALAGGRADANFYGGLGSLAGAYAGYGGFGGGQQAYPAGSTGGGPNAGNGF